MFQPFLRFYRCIKGDLGTIRNPEVVSTLLEILPPLITLIVEDTIATVSTLLEILLKEVGRLGIRRVKTVSTLLEILPLVWLVVVGF